MFTVSSTLIWAVLTGQTDWVCHIGTLMLCIEAVAWSCIIVTLWSGSGGIQAWSWRPTGFLQCFNTVGLVIWPVKIVPEMTYNVLSGTLSLYTTTTAVVAALLFCSYCLVVYLCYCILLWANWWMDGWMNETRDVKQRSNCVITQRRSVAKNVGCFQRRLFLCLFLNTITSERVNTGWWILRGRCTVQKSRPSSNLGVIASLGAHPQKCGVRLRRWENRRRLSSLWYTDTSSECLGQVPMSRSLGQGQGHRSKNGRYETKYTHSRVIRLWLKGKLVYQYVANILLTIKYTKLITANATTCPPQQPLHQLTNQVKCYTCIIQMDHTAKCAFSAINWHEQSSGCIFYVYTTWRIFDVSSLLSLACVQYAQPDWYIDVASFDAASAVCGAYMLSLWYCTIQRNLQILWSGSANTVGGPNMNDVVVYLFRNRQTTANNKKTMNSTKAGN